MPHDVRRRYPDRWQRDIRDTKNMQFCIGCIGISLIGDLPKTLEGRLRTYAALFLTTTTLILMIVGEYAFIIRKMMTLALIEDLIGSNLHIAGYGTMSVLSVCNMLGSDLLFMTMASHISMLLRLLQVKIRSIMNTDTNLDLEGRVRSSDTGMYDSFEEIMGVVKVHQRLINYINDLEAAFSVVNLINVLLSSVNICCVVFTIVFLEPWMEMSNKFFLGAALTQMGIVCWYADDIYRASIGVADAVYESGWYRTNAQCRRALLLVLQRSQKPLYFTALKFRDITMITYSSILTTAYSYFTLLYTSYNKD